MAESQAQILQNPEQKGWFSIKEASEYLGISQPTLYRWMKEGLLSFYKVGGSTRFTQEGLDAVVEKTTGRKEAEAATGRDGPPARRRGRFTVDTSSTGLRIRLLKGGPLENQRWQPCGADNHRPCSGARACRSDLPWHHR